MSKRVRFQIHGWDNDNKNTGNMAETHLNYFTCTLGEAAQWNREHPHPFETINDLIDEQAKDLGQRPAVNFPGGCHGEDGRAMKSGGSQGMTVFSPAVGVLTAMPRLHLQRTS